MATTNTLDTSFFIREYLTTPANSTATVNRYYIDPRQYTGINTTTASTTATTGLMTAREVLESLARYDDTFSSRSMPPPSFSYRVRSPTYATRRRRTRWVKGGNKKYANMMVEAIGNGVDYTGRVFDLITLPLVTDTVPKARIGVKDFNGYVFSQKVIEIRDLKVTRILLPESILPGIDDFRLGPETRVLTASSRLSTKDFHNRVRLFLRHLGIKALRYKGTTLLEIGGESCRLKPGESWELPTPVSLVLPFSTLKGYKTYDTGNSRTLNMRGPLPGHYYPRNLSIGATLPGTTTAVPLDDTIPF